MKDLSSYLANLMTISHDTYVRVLSDLEYYTEMNDRKYTRDLFSESTQQQQEGPLENVLFIGGPKTNKFLRRILEGDEEVVRYLQCNPPVEFYEQISENDLYEQFDIGNEFTFQGKNQAALLNMPCVYQHQNPYIVTAAATNDDNDTQNDDNYSGKKGHDRHINWLLENNARYSGIICANSAQGYLHMSRLAAPTVPPMVRAPFANYIPDYIVIDHRIWDMGFGGVKIAGYWNHEWKYSEHQAYVQ